MPVGSSLTHRQARFVDAFVGEARGNASAAARAAGYRQPRVQGSENLAKPAIKAAVAERLEGATLTRDECLERLAMIARFDATLYLDFDKPGPPAFDLARMKEDGLGFMLKKLTYDRAGHPLVEFHDSAVALGLIAKHLGLLVERVRYGPDLDFDAMSDEQLRALASAKPLRGL